MKSFLLLFLFAFSLYANILEVCETCNIKTIQEAVSNSSNGDTILVKKGVYKEGSLLITKSLTFTTEEGAVIDGIRKANVFDIRANNVTIRGFSIINSGSSDLSEYAGIYIEASEGCKILNNTFENDTYGIYLSKVKNCILEGNSVTGNALDEVSGGNGIHLWSCESITIRKNIIRKHRDGLYLEFSSNLLIEENTSTNSVRYGMHFMFSNNNRFYKNIFIENPTGVAVMYSKKIEVIGNRFEKSWGLTSYGILLKEISDSNFSQNVFMENMVGIYGDSISRNVFSQNKIEKNGWAANILGSCEDNLFEKNDFNDNIFDLSTNSRQNTNTYTGNYWSKYEGYDLNRDMIGDREYNPVQLFSFWIADYPILMILLNSPVIQVLELAEKAFPILTPRELVDTKPRMQPLNLL